jgi:nitrous oxidase accessory protein
MYEELPIEGLGLPWMEMWSKNLPHILAFGLFLIGVLLVAVFRQRLARHPRVRDRVRDAALLVSLLYAGLYLSVQPSTLNLAIFANVLAGEPAPWSFFLLDPFLFLALLFMIGTAVVWGRGVFCGWVCPMGALLELAHRLFQRLAPQYQNLQLPPGAQRALRPLKYGLFLLILGVSFYDFVLADYLSEVEPFKTFVLKGNRSWYFAAYFLLVVAASMILYRFFCRYLCPLGGALALPALLRPFPLLKLPRYDFCGVCKIGERTCRSKAIRPDGSINARECLYCLDCQVNALDPEVCPAIIRQRNGAAKEALRVGVGLLAGFVLLGPLNAEGADLTVGRDAPTIAEALKRAGRGDRVVVPAGTYRERLRIEKPVQLIAQGKAVLRGGGEGPIVHVASAGVRIEGFEITESAFTQDPRGAGIYVEKGSHGAVIRNNRFTAVNYGLWAIGSTDLQVIENVVEGPARLDREARGDCIHLTDIRRAVLRGNMLRHCRDGMYLELSHELTLEGNTISQARFGVHTMWSDRSRFLGNRLEDSLVGLAIMYTRESAISHNLSCGNQTHGILLMQAVRSEIAGNTVVGNTKGLFLYNSLLNTITSNLVMHNSMGVHAWGGSEENRIEKNSFLHNEIQVKFVAAKDQRWDGNYWSDYLGWDADGDGAGDLPYESNTLVDALLWRYPQARLLLASLSLQVLWLVEKQFPVFQVAKVRDLRPALAPHHPDWRQALSACARRPALYWGEMEKLPHVPGGHP